MPIFALTSVRLLGPRTQQEAKSIVRGSVTTAETGGFSIAWIFGFIALHMVLVLVMKQERSVAGAHALATLAFGLWLCFWKSQPLQIAQWAAYVAGSEVLWRMCKAPIPWEFAKYSIALVCLVTVVRSQGTRGSWLPALYFLLLIPASAITFFALPFRDARSQVSFYLSGPICLALCALSFSSLRLTASGFQRVSIMLLGPIGGLAFIVLFRMATTEVNFGSGSEVNASGGYGPNQVSSMLGLGALLAMFLNLEEKCSTWLKGFFVVLTLWFLAQSVLTFSRTGFYLFVVAFGMASVFLAQRKSGGRRLVLLLLVIGAAICAVLPMLDALTGGKLTQRFNDRGLTGRDTIAKLDLEIFRDRPLFGAGIGMSMYYRAVDGDAPAAHTEYTRLLADHGMLGVGALIILLNMTGQAFLRARGPWAKAIVTALAIWALLFMSVTAMRLAVPAFLLGLVHARFLSDKRMRMLVAKTKRKSRLPAQADDYPRMPRASQCLSTIGKFGK